MTEIENIKKQTLASFIKDSLEKDAKIASLITTIESQKEKIEILKSSLQSIKEHSSDRASAAAASSALKMASRIQEGDK